MFNVLIKVIFVPKLIFYFEKSLQNIKNFASLGLFNARFFSFLQEECVYLLAK